MTGSFKIASIKGITLSVHWTFLFLVGWIVLFNLRPGTGLTEMLWALLFVVAVFLCVTLHELGHAFVAARFGIKAKNIILLPIGGVASIEKFPDNPGQELAISVAGPLVNIIIALILLLFIQPYSPYWEMREDAGNIHGYNFLYNLHMVNLGLALFNLVPAFPMDGGRILRALLGFKLNYIRATTIATTIGKIIAVCFIALGILFYNLILPVIGVFIIFSSGTEEHYLRLKSLVKGIQLKEVLMNDYSSLEINMTVKEAASILINNHSKYFILMDNGRPAGSINRMEIIKAIAEMRYEEHLSALVRKNLEYLDGNEDVSLVLEKLAANDERIFPVIDDKHFAGVVNFGHIIEYLLLHKAVTKDYGRVRSLTGLLR